MTTTISRYANLLCLERSARKPAPCPSLQELQSKFDEFKQSVKTGSERFRLCETAANSILRRNPPFARDILKRQEKLRSVWTLLVDYIEGEKVWQTGRQ